MQKSVAHHNAVNKGLKNEKYSGEKFRMEKLTVMVCCNMD